MDARGTQTYAFDGNSVALDAAVSSDCVSGVWNCPMLRRKWPATVSKTDYAVETQVTLTSYATSQTAGIMIWDGATGRNYPAFWVGLRFSAGGVLQVGAEGSYLKFSTWIT